MGTKSSESPFHGVLGYITFLANGECTIVVVRDGPNPRRMQVLGTGDPADRAGRKACAYARRSVEFFWRAKVDLQK